MQSICRYHSCIRFVENTESFRAMNIYIHATLNVGTIAIVRQGVPLFF